MNKVLIIVSLLLCSTGAFAKGSKFLNLRYGLGTGPMIEFGLGRVGLGVTTDSGGYDGTDSLGNYSYKYRLLGGRLSYYTSGMGSDSWYLAASGGTVTVEASQTIGGTAFDSSATATYAGGALGYHWFWSYFNLNLGLGTLTMNIPDVEMKNSAGVKQNTIEGISITLPTIDFGIGLAF